MTKWDDLERAVRVYEDFQRRLEAGEDVSVESLLAQHEDLRELIEPLVDPNATPEESIGRFQIRGVLGRGGMGVVYRAYDPALDRETALKVILQDQGGSAAAVSRFLREAKITSKLDHPRICTVYEPGMEGDRVFLSMQLVEGETLREWLASRRTLPSGEDLVWILRFFATVADTLHFAHERGVVHRDVKPANLMVDADREPVVLDFGVAKLHEGTELTRTGTQPGTASYASPEQLQGEEPDPRNDIWSLGLVVCEVLGGRHPFAGDDVFDTMDRIRSAPATELLQQRNSAVTNAIVKVLERATAVAADDRPISMAVFAEELRSVAAAVGRVRDANQWYYRSVHDEDEVGPVTTAGLRKLLANGALDPEDLVRRADGEEWRRARELMPARPAQAPRPTETVAATQVSVEPAERRAGGIGTIVMAVLLVVGGSIGGFAAFGGSGDDPVDPKPDPFQDKLQQHDEDDKQGEEDEHEEDEKEQEEQDRPRPGPTRDAVWAEYVPLAQALQESIEVILLWMPGQGTPATEVSADFARLAAEAEDADIRRVAAAAGAWWGSLPKELLAFEMNSLEGIMLNLILNQAYSPMLEMWNESLDRLQKNCWLTLLPIVRRMHAEVPEARGLADVELAVVQNRLHFVLRNTSGRALRDATVSVRFDRLGADPLYTHTYFDSWVAGAKFDLTQWPALMHGGSLVVSSEVSVWENKAKQLAEVREYASRRSAIEARIARAERIKANRAALETALREGTTLEGGWVLGKYAGAIGFELVASAGRRGYTARLYDPANPAVRKDYNGHVSFDADNERFRLTLRPGRGGLRQDRGREPSSLTFITQRTPVHWVELWGDDQDFRGVSNIGSLFQLYPKGSGSADTLVREPGSYQGDRAVLSSARVEPIPARVFASMPAASRGFDGPGVELQRWDLGHDRHVPHVFLARTTNSIYWSDGRTTSRTSAGSSDKTMPDVPGEFFSLSADERAFATFSGGFFRLRDLGTGAEIGIKDPKNPRHFFRPLTSRIVLDPSGNVIGGSREGEVTVWSHSAQPLWGPVSQTGRLNDLSISKDGRVLCSAMDDGNVNVWSLETGARLGELRGTLQVHDTLVSPDAKFALTIEQRPRRHQWRLQVWDMSKPKFEKLHTIAFAKGRALGVSPDWRKAFASAEDSQVYVWDLTTGENTQVLAGHQFPVESVSVRDDGMVVTGGGDGWIALWSLAKDAGQAALRARPGVPPKRDVGKPVAPSPVVVPSKERQSSGSSAPQTGQPTLQPTLQPARALQEVRDKFAAVRRYCERGDTKRANTAIGKARTAARKDAAVPESERNGYTVWADLLVGERHLARAIHEKDGKVRNRAREDAHKQFSAVLKKRHGIRDERGVDVRAWAGYLGVKSASYVKRQYRRAANGLTGSYKDTALSRMRTWQSRAETLRNELDERFTEAMDSSGQRLVDMADAEIKQR